MLSVVTWKWKAPSNYRTRFESRHVNVLRSMVERHYKRPHRFICVTDDPRGLHSSIEVVRDKADFAGLPNLTDVRDKIKHPMRMAQKRPSCYRRLRAFQPEASEIFGERFVSLDLDTVITDDIMSLWDREEDCVFYREPGYSQYNGSMMLLRAGARPKVWTDFTPKKCETASAAGFRGSDQAWISFCLWPSEPIWTDGDGVYSYVKDNLLERGLPQDARMVMFHGRHDPWSPVAQQQQWVREHWC